MSARWRPRSGQRSTPISGGADPVTAVLQRTKADRGSARVDPCTTVARAGGSPDSSACGLRWHHPDRSPFLLSASVPEPPAPPDWLVAIRPRVACGGAGDRQRQALDVALGPLGKPQLEA